MKKLLLLGVLFLSMNIYAQKTPQDMIKDFFTTYEKDPGNALKELYKTNVWMERVKDDIDNMAIKINSFTIDYVRKYYGYESIAIEKYSESFVLYSFLVKYDRQPLKFTFKFYKPKDKWVLYEFKYDDTFSGDIEEAAKINHFYKDK